MGNAALLPTLHAPPIMATRFSTCMMVGNASLLPTLHATDPCGVGILIDWDLTDIKSAQVGLSVAKPNSYQKQKHNSRSTYDQYGACGHPVSPAFGKPG